MDELLNYSAVGLRQMIQRRELSARELLSVHLSHIEKINPSVNAIVTLTAELAETRARALDELQAKGKDLGVLHGLPMAHKDLAMTEGIRTTFGGDCKGCRKLIQGGQFVLDCSRCRYQFCETCAAAASAKAPDWGHICRTEFVPPCSTVLAI